MEANFFIEQISISNRHTEVQKIKIDNFNEADGRKQERMTVTIELVGSGDTTSITDVKLIETILQKIRIGIIK